MNTTRHLSEDIQRRHLERGRQHWLKSQFCVWNRPRKACKPTIQPYEGHWINAPCVQYDVSPDRVARQRRTITIEASEKEQSNVLFNETDIVATVDNIVHTTYISPLDRPRPPPKKKGKPDKRPAIFTHLWLARRCMHLGFSENRVRGAIEFSFRSPYTATDLLFMNGRVMCTGSPTRSVAQRMVQFLIDEICDASDARLTLEEFVPQNIVATAKLSFNLLLPLMATQKNVDYTPSQFPGAVVKYRRPKVYKVKMLTFTPGYIICVGANKLEHVKDAYVSMMPFFRRFEDTPENVALMKRALRVLTL